MTKMLKQEGIRYTQINNEIITCETLSWKAKGVYCYLWSKPNCWSFYIADIVKNSKDGKEAVQSALKELEMVGLLKRVPVKDPDTGKFNGYDYKIWHQFPADGKTRQRDIPDNGETPSHSNPDLFSNTDLLSKTNQNNKLVWEKIFNHWNSKKIIIHKSFDEYTKKQITKLLREFSIDDILNGIDVYSDVYKSKDTFFSYKWTLYEFLSRKNGFRVFLYKTVDDYLIDKKPKKQNNYGFQELQPEDFKSQLEMNLNK